MLMMMITTMTGVRREFLCVKSDSQSISSTTDPFNIKSVSFFEIFDTLSENVSYYDLQFF